MFTSIFFQSWVFNRLLAHILIGFLFGYLYRDVGKKADTILANYVYLYGSLLLAVYTGKMPVTLMCKYYTHYFLNQ